MGRLSCYSNYAVHKHWNWHLLQIQWRTSENYGGTQLSSIVASFLKKVFLKIKLFSSTFFSYIIVTCFTGILHCKSINGNCTCCRCFGGILHVGYHVAWRIRWELHIWDAICCNKHIVFNRHSTCVLRILTSVLQITGDQRLRGKSCEIE